MTVIKAGDAVDVNTVGTGWVGPYPAMSGVERHPGHGWPTVLVQPDGWDHPVNWRARDVRPHRSSTTSRHEVTG